MRNFHLSLEGSKQTLTSLPEAGADCDAPRSVDVLDKAVREATDEIARIEDAIARMAREHEEAQVDERKARMGRMFGLVPQSQESLDTVKGRTDELARDIDAAQSGLEQARRNLEEAKERAKGARLREIDAQLARLDERKKEREAKVARAYADLFVALAENGVGLRHKPEDPFDALTYMVNLLPKHVLPYAQPFGPELEARLGKNPLESLPRGHQDDAQTLRSLHAQRDLLLRA